MHPALLLLLGAALAAPAAPPNLDFRTGRLDGWQGEGFDLTTATGHGPGLSFGVCSSDVGPPGRTGLLHKTFILPSGVGTIHFTAFAWCGPGGQTDNRLNVFLEAPGRRIIPKLVRGKAGYEPCPHLLPPRADRPREYLWQVADLAGERVRIIILDQDRTPGRSVFCSGFRTEAIGAFDAREFSRFLNTLVVKHRLSPMGSRYRSRHFLAAGNADEEFTRKQLERCEWLYASFLAHFRSRGFSLRAPAAPLMVAVFDSQEGLEAYLNTRTPELVTGIYHPASNRLIVYDFGRNRALVRSRERAADFARSLPTDLDRNAVLGSVSVKAGFLREDANVATIMHEAAHLMSFNTGMLDRKADLPIWLVEGLATYCEPTAQGNWKGIGEVNTDRLRLLAAALKGKGEFLPLRSLLEGDAWLRGPGGGGRALMGYAQSWALFHMLMQEQPGALRRYLKLIYARRTPDHRLADFAQVFGADLNRLEQRHRAHIKRLVETVH
jgi:Protein of unknown function (DUF1570)